MKTIKRGDGFHVYTVPDPLQTDLSEPATLYLDLTDCDYAVFRERGKSGVTVKLSEDMAARLGLIGWDGMAKWRAS